MLATVHITFTHLSAYQELIKGTFINFCTGEFYKKLSSQLKIESLEVLTVMLLTTEVSWMWHCHWMSSSQQFEGTLCLWNIRTTRWITKFTSQKIYIFNLILVKKNLHKTHLLQNIYNRSSDQMLSLTSMLYILSLSTAPPFCCLILLKKKYLNSSYKFSKKCITRHHFRSLDQVVLVSSPQVQSGNEKWETTKTS